MLKFTRQVEVEAIQWDGSVAGTRPIMDWIIQNKSMARYHNERVIQIDTPSGMQFVYPHHWVVKEPDGSFAVYEEQYFEDNFQPVYTEIKADV